MKFLKEFTFYDDSIMKNVEHEQIFYFRKKIHAFALHAAEVADRVSSILYIVMSMTLHM